MKHTTGLSGSQCLTMRRNSYRRAVEQEIKERSLDIPGHEQPARQPPPQAASFEKTLNGPSARD